MSGHFLRDCLRAPQEAWALVNTTTGHTIAGRLELAVDRESRNRGLLGRDGLPAGAALVLAPCWSIHTWFMRFALDVVFVDRDGTVLKLRRGIGPWRLAICPGAFAVIEFAAGGAGESGGITPGQRLAVLSASGQPAV